MPLQKYFESPLRLKIMNYVQNIQVGCILVTTVWGEIEADEFDNVLPEEEFKFFVTFDVVLIDEKSYRNDLNWLKFSTAW